MWLDATILDSAVLDHPDQHIHLILTVSHHISLNESMHFSEDNTKDTGHKLLAQNHTVIPQHNQDCNINLLSTLILLQLTHIVLRCDYDTHKYIIVSQITTINLLLSP